MHGKLSSTELRTLKREFQTIKDELAKVASSNRALRKRVRDLEESLKHEKQCQKNTKCVEDFSKTLASVEHSFKLEIEELKKRNGGLNEHDEGHEEVGNPHTNEGDDNDMSPVHEYITPTTKPTEMEAQVSGDGAEAFVAMQVQEAEIGTSVPEKQVQQEVEKLPTPEDVDRCGVICKKRLPLLEDWKKSDIKACQMNLLIIANVIMAGE
ncbi:hypothetical protein L3X38_003940 [Prunus dulcis]|uniref:Uncharacterized protein n=1 Tax=Prunus dulcis TaxID=3755 RepID=A0AAD5F2Q6_PRUDU|nr:hypothetical protein L3X38_003940 [Prunus dulcis]